MLSQWLAMLTMVVDHVGIIWFPDDPTWRMIGRLAFPVYAYYIALGMRRTRNIRGYIKRLAILALISQIPFMLAFQHLKINVIGTFVVAVYALYRMDQAKPALWSQMFWLAGGGLVLGLLPFDYGLYALALILIYRHTDGIRAVALHTGLNVLYGLEYGAWVQMWSVLPTLWLCLRHNPSLQVMPVPRWVWRSFYPAHLAILFVCRLFF